MAETWVNKVREAETEWRQLKRNVAAGRNLGKLEEEKGMGERRAVVLTLLGTSTQTAFLPLLSQFILISPFLPTVYFLFSVLPSSQPLAIPSSLLPALLFPLILLIPSCALP